MDPGDVYARSTTVLTPAQPEPITLRELLGALGPHALRLIAGHRLDQPVGEPLVHGPGEPLPHVGESIVFLTGAHAGQQESLRQIAAAGGHTVVLKAWKHEIADDHGLTLLCTPDEMTWRHLDALITTARLAGSTVNEPSGDLFSLANAIAASLGGPVTIEETSGRIMAYSNLPGQDIDDIRRRAILGRQTPERPTNAVEYQAVLTAPGPVFFESSHPDYADRLAVAVRAGHQVLGVIFVLCDRPRLVDDADRVLFDAARTTAMHLLRLRGSHDPDRTRRGEALRGLLADTLDAPAAAAALGLPVTTSLVVAVVRPVAQPGLHAAQVADLVALHGEYWHAGAASVLDGGDLVLLLPGPTSTNRLRKLGADLATAARRSAGVELRIGFGPEVSGLECARRSRQLADRVLRAGRDVALLDDVRSELVLTALPDDDEALLLPQVRAVLDHDTTQGTDYAATLLTYLGTSGNITATAQALNVHENTARYRVRRLTERFGIELGAGDETLVTWLQLRNACRRPQDGPHRSVSDDSERTDPGA
ncbi:PucR family transcriptional regulator [Cryptosporangium sp. NPDC048952]|uniref:PucR family transcriptional regulator n=1 Tax=Cryptosporangium sp. NPDC048952 TaxID=3363961 RepID=UPI003713D59D